MNAKQFLIKFRSALDLCSFGLAQPFQP